jgi:hypothetical protein
MLRWRFGATGACAILMAAAVPALPQGIPKPGAASDAGPDQGDGVLKARPLGNPGEWLSTEDYPREALLDDVSGTTGFRLAFDEQGLPTHCSVTESSGSALLDATTCGKLMERARFHPLVDESGRAVPGSYESTVRWWPSGPAPDPNATTPQPLDMELWVSVTNLLYDPATPGDLTVAYALEVDETGGVTNCAITGSSGDELFDRSVCRQLEVNATFDVSSSGPGRYTGSHTEYEQVLRAFPQTVRPRPGARNYAVQTYIEEDGSVSGCKWMGRNSPEVDPWPVCTRSSWVDQQDIAGKPVRGRVTLQVDEDRIAELANPDEVQNSRNRGLTLGFDEDRNVSVCRWNGANPPAFDALLGCNLVAKSMSLHEALAGLVKPGATFNVTLDESEVAALQAQHDRAKAAN